MAIHLYYTTLDCQTFNTSDVELLRYVSHARQDRVSKVRPIRDKKLSLYAGLLARMQLSTLLSVPHGSLKFEVLQRGKPRLLGYPSIDFSVSHTDGFVLCGVSTSGSVGVDVERLSTPNMGVMRRVYTPQEVQYVLSESTLQAERFFKVWTQKEAYAKYLGCGLCGEVFKANTLEPRFATGSLSWLQGDYVCSASSSGLLDGYTVQYVPYGNVKRFFEVE